MKKLLKLEISKNKLRPYLWASIWIFVFGVIFCFFTAFIPKIEPTEASMFQDWSSFISLISILQVAAFGVFSAVMHTRFTVEEYTGKRAILLFSYPQSRSKILLAKCLLVFGFTVIAVMLCNTASIGIFAFFSNVCSIMPELFTISILKHLIITSFISALLAASIGLISMRVGFWKKSLIATVVTSVLLIAPFGNLLSTFPTYSFRIAFFGMTLLLLIGILILIHLLSSVNRMEAL